MAELKRNNINIHAYKVTPETPQRAAAPQNAWPVIPAGFPGLAMPMPANAVPTGGAVPAITPVGILYDGGGPDTPRDARSGDVTAHITVDDAQVKAAEASLISMGGRQITVNR